MSETGSSQNEATSEDSLMDSVVAATVDDREELNTPNILCGLKGLRQKKSGSGKSIFDFRGPASSPSYLSSPMIPYQTANRFNQPETSLSQSTKQETCSEPMSPSLLPQTDGWRESFSIIPPFLKKKADRQQMESQSQSLLPQTAGPQTNTRADNMTLQPSCTRTLGSTPATFSPDRSQMERVEATKPDKWVTQASKKQKKQRNRYKEKIASVLNSASPRFEFPGKPLCSERVPQELPLEKTSKKRPDSLLIPTQSSTRSYPDTSDATEKINQRIEKQLVELEHAPRKKMLVIEAAVLHCVTSVQDNIEKKFGKLKHSYNRENADTLRKLLQTLKSTLGRLIEHQRKEREQFAGVTQASLSQLSQVEMMVQTSQLVELGKRQKAVVELLAKQKDLASKLKEMDSANDGSRERKNNETDVDTTMKNIPNRENLNKASDNNNNNEFTKNGNMPKCLAKDAGMSLSDANKLPKKKQNRKSKNKIQAGSDKETSSEEIKKDFGNPATGLSKLEEISFSDNSSSGMGPATQESGSGLMDILKILGNRKRQKSISELARSVHELASGSNSEASSTSAMVDQDSLRDDTTVDSDHESANFTEKNKGAAGNLEKNALDTTNYDSEETINEKENIREKMSVIPTKEAERLNDKSNTIADSADIDEVRESVSELIKADDISLEKTGKRNVVKEIAKKKVHVKESSLTENQEKADFVKENNVTINQREESNSLVLSLDKIEMCVKRSEKKIMEQTKNKTENQDILMTDENVSNQEDNSKGIKSGTTAKSVAETENDAEKELEIDDKGVTEMVNSGKSAPNKTSKIHDDAVKNRAGKPSILYEPPDASNKTGKRSLSDYDPSTGGIDPRTVYGHTKASSPEMVYINDESSPEAIKPKSFYKQKVGTITDRDDTLGLDAAGCVTDRHQDEEMLSQDVTTIPDTQEPSTQETITRESPVKVTQLSEKTGRKRKQSTSSDEKASSCKKYTKTNKKEVFRGIDKYENTTAQNKTVSEVTEIDKTKTKIAANYNKPVNMFNQQPVDNVLLKNNHAVIDFQTNVDRQNALAQRSVANNDKEKGIAPVNNKQLKETNTVSERLWTEMMKQTDKHKTSMTKTKIANNSLVDKQRDSVPLKSPGEKLDKVIKRIREEKENKVGEKANDRSARIEYTDSSFKMPELDKSLNKKDLGNHLLKNSTMPGGKSVWNYNSLQQAGLVVGLDLPQDKTVLPKQVALKPVSQSAKHTDSLMFSPSRQIQDDAGTDVSPTATSMSSDVFLVKAKELDRRMKLRAEMSQRLASQTEMSQRLAGSQTENQRVNVGNNSDTHIGPQGMAPRKTKTNISNKMDLPQTVKKQVTVQNKGNWISKLPEKASEKVEECTGFRQSLATDAGMIKTMKTKTSAEKIDAVIDDVIKSAAALGDEKECSQNKISQNIKSSQSIFSQNTDVMKKAANQVPYISDETNNSLSCQVPGSQMVLVKSQGQNYALSLQAIHMKVVQSGSKVPGQGRMEDVDSTQDIVGNSQVSQSFETQANTTQVVDPLKPVLPTMKTMIHRGLLRPGTDVLSVFVKMVDPLKPVLPTMKTMIHRGLLRPGTNVLSVFVKNQTIAASLTPQGMIRSTSGEIFRTPMQWLMSLEPNRGIVKRRRSYERITYNGHSLLSYCSYTSNIKQRTTSPDRSQVEGTSNWDDTDEGRLNKFLSTCRIRLLSKEDLIPCDDLPDNFWANDFADVKVPSDIWECVNMWD